MKTQNKQQALLLASIAAIFLLGAFASTFAQGIGAKYGSREPRTCADTKAPAKGAMTAALATKYLICNSEHVYGENLYLVEDVSVQVGAAVPYNPKFSPPDIDVKASTYPLRASFRQYQCGAVYDDKSNYGTNCTVYNQPKATGRCYKTTFGDWNCNASDLDTKDREYSMRPPGFKMNAAADAPAKDKPIAAKDNKQTAATKTAADENKDDSGFPKPDFSEIDKWYEITRYEYGDIAARENRLFFWFKTKKAARPGFFVEYRDKDGALVQNGRMAAGEDGVIVDVGEAGHGYAVTPSESVMKTVVSVKFVRDKD